MSNEHILIVDDESLVAMDLRIRLEGLGYTVDGVAVNGHDAIELAREVKPDLILMDIMIEGDMDGIQTAMLVRQQLQIPVIYVTASSDSETLDRAMQTEPFGFIHKPLDPMELHSAIEIAIYKSRMDRKLRDSEIRYRRLVESVTDYIYTVKLENGRAVSTTHNPACVAVTGYSLEEYQSDPDLWFKMVPLVDRPKVLDQARRLLSKHIVQPLEHRLIHKSGMVIWVRNTTVPHFDENGRLIAYDGLLSNITERKVAEAALRESEEKYRMLSEQSLVGIQIIKNGRLIFVNEGWSKIVGYSRAEALAWEAEEICKVVHPDDRVFFMEQMHKKQSGISDGVIPVYDCRFLCREGVTKWVLMHSKPVMFADGLAIVGVVVDITDRKLAEQALAEANCRLKAGEERLMAANQELSDANRDKEVLLKEIHHRVKNNLQVISSLLNLQVSHVRDTAARTVLRECQNRIKSIAIVHEKLYQSPNLANIDLAEYIRSLISHLFRTFLVDPQSIHMNIAIAQVSLDVDQAIPCCLIINELVTNSLKYAFPNKQGGEISIALKRDVTPEDHSGAVQYLLVIGDEGIGFPSGVDFRNTASLGMQLVLTFVQQLEGTIDLDSRRGTVFTIRFAGGQKNALPIISAGGPAG